MGRKGKATVQLLKELDVLVSFDVISLSKDAELVFEHVQAALEKDNEQRGHGIRRQPWGLDTFEKQLIPELFRFKTKEDIQNLMDQLALPPDEYWLTPSGTRFTREEAMTFFLRRMCYPTKLTLVHLEGFHAQIGALSELYTMVSEWLFLTHTERLLQTGLTKWAHRVPLYAQVIQDYTGVPWRCFGFIDGTARPISCSARTSFAPKSRCPPGTPPHSAGVVADPMTTTRSRR